MIQGDIVMRSEHRYNFKAIGQAIKKARESKRCNKVSPVIGKIWTFDFVKVISAMVFVSGAVL